jgi:hypothetical protein
MDRNAYRDENGTDQPEPYRREYDTDQPDTYWRRRAATLAAGLGVLGLLAWACSGGGGKPAGSAAQNSPASGTLSAPASPGATAPGQASSSASSAAGADAAVPGLASQGTSGLPSASPSAASGASGAGRGSARRGSAGTKSAGTKSGDAASTAQAGPEPGGRCAPGSVVLSLFSGSRSYTGGQDPQFGVDAVSTAPGTCTFDLSPTQLHLVVMSAGRVIWDSADCARDGTQLSRLTRGIPVQESFTWNRAITLPGCVTLASSARPGSYSAQARAATIASGVYTFRLAGH